MDDPCRVTRLLGASIAMLVMQSGVDVLMDWWWDIVDGTTDDPPTRLLTVRRLYRSPLPGYSTVDIMYWNSDCVVML